MSDVLCNCANAWSVRHVEALMVEECGELCIELARVWGRPDRADVKKVQEEIADVLITAWTLAQQYDKDNGVTNWLQIKLNREVVRMDDPTYCIESKTEKAERNYGGEEV
jgi:NTP pyrophosphatase (non-canonical NTP hydrolase)